MKRKTHVGSRFEEPFASRFGVGDGLLCGESLGSDDEESSLGVASLGDFGDVSSVDVGNEVHRETLLSVRLESLGDHDRSEIRSSDTDVDDSVDSLASVTFPFSRTNLVGELSHVLQNSLDFVCSSFVNLELVGADVTKGDVKDSTVFRGVDVLSREHFVASGFDSSFFSELNQVLPYFFVDQVLGVIEEDVNVLLGRVVRLREFFESLGVRVEEFTEYELGVILVVELLKSGPRRVICIEKEASRVS